MLKLHPQQMSLRIVPEAGFIDWYVNDFMPEQLPDYYRAIAPGTLGEMVKNGRDQALKHGFKDPANQAHFITLMWHIGANFHHAPGFKAIAQAGQSPESERINAFYQVSEAHWDDAVKKADDRHWFSGSAQ